MSDRFRNILAIFPRSISTILSTYFVAMWDTKKQHRITEKIIYQNCQKQPWSSFDKNECEFSDDPFFISEGKI